YIQGRGGENYADESIFRGVDDILLTHGHFDHAQSIPQIVKARETCKVYCTETPAQTLLNKGVGEEQLQIFQAGDIFQIGDITIKTYQGKHCQFDRELVEKTILSKDVIRFAGKLGGLLMANKSFPENGETIFYELQIGERRIQVMGSMGLNPEVEYPTQADLLVLPYQGKSQPVPTALGIIGRLQPKRLMLSHFDNAFPPMSKKVDTIPLKKALEKFYPDLPAVKPRFAKKIGIR
ncbi:MAG: MBL fold metallo-hydrolase, partial [Lachnospiraceae bacterium]|nr:MBL fold metallo-hydrolase [Candidatus Equihabitans merdae]